MTATTSRPTRRGYRLWFLLDGIVTGLNAIAYVVASSVVALVLGGTPTLYITAGVILLAVTAGLFVVARSKARLEVLAASLVVINILWAAVSFMVAAVNPVGFTFVGIAWAVLQGLVVLAFGLLQAWSLRADRDRA